MRWTIYLRIWSSIKTSLYIYSTYTTCSDTHKSFQYYLHIEKNFVWLKSTKSCKLHIWLLRFEMKRKWYNYVFQVGLINCGSIWSPFYQENTNSRLQNRLSTHFQHRPLISDRYAPISRSSQYRSPTQSSTRRRRKLEKPDRRSLEIVDSKLSDNKSFNENIEEPNYSAFSGLSSFASFNIIGNRNLPESQFSCRDRAPGYYADIELDCKVRKVG